MRLSTREPVSRPLDVVALEVLLTVSQAYLVGALLWLGRGFWAERGVENGPVLAVLIVLALTAGAGWLLWLLGADGRLMAAADVPIALLLAFLWILLGQGVIGDSVDGWAFLAGVGAALLGIGCGVALPSPRERRRPAIPQARPRSGRVPPTPRLTPTTARAVARLPKVRVPAAVTRGVASAGASVRSGLDRRGGEAAAGGGLSVAPDVPATTAAKGDATAGRQAGSTTGTDASRPTGSGRVPDAEDWDDPTLVEDEEPVEHTAGPSTGRT
jgi:hypothetical protein